MLNIAYIMGFIGVAIGLYTGFAIMFAISSAEHQRMHDLLEQHGIEEHAH